MGRVSLFHGDTSVELGPGETVVGRDARCRIRIHAPWVSRRHARFFLEDDELWVSDLGSRNGTRVNGAEITAAAAKLEPGDEIALGNRRVTLVVCDDESSELDTAVVEPFAPSAAWSSVEHLRAERAATITQELVRPSPRGRERRRHIRHSLEVPVRYESEVLQVEAISLNLSASGVFIQTPILDEVGTRCELTVASGELEPLRLCGEVRRVVDHPGAPEPLGLGIEFSDLEDGARRWLEAALSRRSAPAPRS